MKKYRFFTKEEDSFILAHKDSSTEWVAKQLKRSRGSVQYRKRKLGVGTGKKRGPINDELRKEIFALWNDGVIIRRISEITGVEYLRVKAMIDYAKTKGDIVPDRHYKNDIPTHTYPPMKERMDGNHVYAYISMGESLAEGNVREISEAIGVELKELRRMLRDSYLRDANGKRWKYLLYLYDENEME